MSLWPLGHDDCFESETLLLLFLLFSLVILVVLVLSCWLLASLVTHVEQLRPIYGIVISFGRIRDCLCSFKRRASKWVDVFRLVFS